MGAFQTSSHIRPDLLLYSRLSDDGMQVGCGAVDKEATF